jgi:hypothetical protein
MLGKLSGTFEDGYFEAEKLRIVIKEGTAEVYMDGVLVDDGYSLTLHITPVGVEFTYIFEE